MPATASPLGQGWHRITTECVAVGLRFPPADVQGRLATTPNGYLLRVAPPAGQDVARWLRMVGALHIEAEPEGLRARFTTLPDSVDIVAREARIDEVTVTRAGLLSITCLPAPEGLEGILAMLDTRPHDRDAALTPRQEEMLEHCVAAGYYAIPREAHLRQLAQELGVSMPTLSLALRRAEAKVMAAYVGRKRPVPPSGEPSNQSQDPRAEEDTLGLGPGAKPPEPAPPARPQARRRKGPPSRL